MTYFSFFYILFLFIFYLANYALPVGSGYIKAGEGWVETINANASLTSVFYATFDISSMGVFSSYPRIYKTLTYSPSNTGVATGDITTIPVYTAIIQMDNGVVSNIGWDDGCFFCAENTDTCAFSAFNANASLPIADSTLRGCRKASDECYADAFTNDQATNTTGNATLTAGNCDLKIFLTWTGTDRNGQYLRSANKRFSRYRAFGVATAYQAAVNIAEEGMNIANTAIGEIKAVPGKILPGFNEERRLGSSFHTKEINNEEETIFGEEGNSGTEEIITNSEDTVVMEAVTVVEHPEISSEDIEASYHNAPPSHSVQYIPYKQVKINENIDIEYDYYDDGPAVDISSP